MYIQFDLSQETSNVPFIQYAINYGNGLNKFTFQKHHNVGYTIYKDGVALGTFFSWRFIPCKPYRIKYVQNR